MAISGPRPGVAGPAEAGGGAGGGAEARPLPDAGRRSCVLSGDPSRTRRTCTRPPSPPTSSCWPPTRAGWLATGAPRRSCVAMLGERRSGWPSRSDSSASAPGEAEAGAARPRAAASRRDDYLPRLMLSRADAIEAIAGQRFDVVVIGGGITGAGVALDAAPAATPSPCVERDDYAVGTSSRSSKMVHGGLRYLQNFDLGLVREALLERQLMVQLAPHLVYPTPFLVPTLGEDRRSRRLGHRAEHVRRHGDHPGRSQPARDAGLRGRGRRRLLVAGPPSHDRRARRPSS